MKVNTDELVRQASQFRPVINKMQDATEIVQQVIVALQEESIGEKFAPVLDDARSQIKEQVLDLVRLKGTLELVAESYCYCEEKILDKAEDPGFRLQPIRTHFIQFVGESEQPAALQWVPWDPD